MPDISKCKGGNCSLKESCYRYTSIPSKYRQSYFLEPPWTGTECEYYWADKVDNQLKNIELLDRDDD